MEIWKKTLPFSVLQRKRRWWLIYKYRLTDHSSLQERNFQTFMLHSQYKSIRLCIDSSKCNFTFLCIPCFKKMLRFLYLDFDIYTTNALLSPTPNILYLYGISPIIEIYTTSHMLMFIKCSIEKYIVTSLLKWSPVYF